MVINKDSVIIDRKVGNANMQIMSEGEITISEDREDIGTLLKCDSSFIVDENRISDGRVSFNGRLKLKGMYLSKGENKTVHSFSHEMPVSDFVNIENAGDGMNVYINCVSTVSQCRMVNERKLFYKVITDAEVSVREQKECMYVSGLGEIPENQQRFTKFSAETLAVHKQDSFTVRDSLTLPMGKPNIEEMLDCELKITSVDYKTGEDGVRVSGDLNVSVIYKGEGENNPMELYEGSIPFKGELEAEGLKENMLCDVRLEIKDSIITVQPDEDGEMRIVDVEAVTATLVDGREINEINVLGDVYILNKDTRLTVNEIEGSICIAKNTGQCPVKEVVALDEKAPDMLQIYRVDGKPYVDFVQINDGRIETEGALALNVLYVTGNDAMPVYCCKATIPFKHTAQASGAQNGMESNVWAQLEHIGFNMVSDRELEVRCVINICAKAEDKRQYEFVGDVVIEDIDREYLSSLASITLYVVRKGDTLWKLAKKFNTTVEDIAAINDIENVDLIYPGQRLIIVKKIA